MSRYTEAYSRFVNRMPEVIALQTLAIDQLRRKVLLEEAKRTNALCRAAVVLLSSHIEGYMEDLAEIIVSRVVDNGIRKDALSTRFLYHFSKDIIDEISETRDPDKIATKIRQLFERDEDIWSDRDTFTQELVVDRFVAGFSTPRFEEIRRFIARFGYREYRYDLSVYLKANFQPCVRMVDNVVEQRNKIAHGDAVTTATPKDVGDMAKLVKEFCRSTDVVVGNWFRGIGCPIR